MRSHTWLLALAAFVAMQAGALAQDSVADPQAPQKPTFRQWRPATPQKAPRWYISANGGYQATSNRFSNTWSFDYYADTGSATATYPVKAGFLVDIGGGARLRRNLFLGAAVSYYSRSSSVAVSAMVPHPFFFDMRPAQGSDSGLARNETAVHFHAMWKLRPRGKFEAGLFAGPSVFRTQQLLATIPNFVEAYPYDTVTFSTVKTERQSKTSIGVNLGADISYMMSRQVGLGVLVRFARTNATLQSPDNKQLSVGAGGAQVGIGLRLRF